MAQSKKQGKGLRFNANFESGNIGQVTVISDHEYDITIQPDTGNLRHRLWFYFSVSNIPFKNFRILLHITNFSKSKSLYRSGMSPVVRSRSRPDWVRVPEKQVFYYRCPRHRKNYVLSFAFEFDKPDDEYYFAYSYPYTYTDLQRYLHKLETRKLAYFKRELLTETIQNRRLDLLTITSPTPGSKAEGTSGATSGAGVGAGAGAPTEPELPVQPTTGNRVGLLHSRHVLTSTPVVSPPPKPKRTSKLKAVKPMIFLTARVHPGESPAQYICQGLIDFLVSDDPEAKDLRSKFVFKIVPMLNPDGVFLGNYRCSYLGDDLNRHWLHPSVWAHKEIFATKALLLKYFSSEDAHLDTFIDIHAHTTAFGSFMYCNSVADREQMLTESLIPKLLHNRAKDFSFQRTRFDQNSAKAGTGRRAVGALLAPRVTCYTLEVSFFASTTSTLPGSTKNSYNVYTQQSYMNLGRDVALTFLDYHKALKPSLAAGRA